MKPRLKEDFVGVQVADTGEPVLAQQEGLQPAAASPDQGGEAAGGELRTERLDPERTQAGHGIEPPGVDKIDVTEPPLVDEADLARPYAEHEPRVRTDGRPPRHDLEIPRHSKMTGQHQAAAEPHEQVLSAPAHGSDAPPAQPPHEHGRRRRSHNGPVPHRHAVHPPSGERPVQTAGENLDIGKFGHGPRFNARRSGSSSRPRGLQERLGNDTLPCVRGGLDGMRDYNLVETEQKVETLKEELDGLRRSREKVRQAPPVEWIKERLIRVNAILERNPDRSGPLLRGLLGPVRLDPARGDIGRPYYRATTSLSTSPYWTHRQTIRRGTPVRNLCVGGAGGN
jgi:hypothetical protein